MHLNDPHMTSLPPAARDYFLACYTVSLVQGKTINGGLIKYITIKKYLKEAYTFFGDLPYTLPHGFVHIILKAVKDYEEVPRRQHMITDGIMQ